MTTNAARLGSTIAAAVLGVGSAVALPGTANADSTVVKVAASDDTYSSSSRPSYNFGGSGKLYAGKVNGDTLVTYLKFTVTDAKVASASLTLTRDDHKFPATVKLSKVANTTWTEKVLNAKNDPAVGALIKSVSPAAADTSVTFDVSSVVKGAGTYTFAVTSTATNDSAHFRSSEATTGQPALNLTVPTAPEGTPAVPPPPAPSPEPVPAPAPGDCAVDAKLVPSCGVLWGAAAGGFSTAPRDEALKTFEAKTGRTAAIFHTYHKGDEQFPTASEIAMTNDPAHPRTLMLNWKVSYGTTWAKVAAGAQDARIDKEAAYLKANFTKPFFLVLHHEPENDVNATAGSGMTAKDFAAMFRHTILRLRADGVTNAISTIAYMNYEKWNDSSWWFDLYPGDDVVDWIGVDSYLNAQPGGYHNGDFTSLMNRTTGKSKFPGFYTWATTQHPTKPIVAAEWGVYDLSSPVVGANKAKVFDTVLPDLTQLPALKAIVYFETAKDQSGHDIRVDDTPEALAAFKKIAADPRFDVKL